MKDILRFSHPDTAKGRHARLLDPAVDTLVIEAKMFKMRTVKWLAGIDGIALGK